MTTRKIKYPETQKLFFVAPFYLYHYGEAISERLCFSAANQSRLLYFSSHVHHLECIHSICVLPNIIKHMVFNQLDCWSRMGCKYGSKHGVFKYCFNS